MYLDNHSTTPCDPAVVKEMLPYFTDFYANPSSTHKLGQRAKRTVERARQTIAEYIGSFKGEIIFTSGATESNNIVIQGLIKNAIKRNVKRKNIITSAIEHKSILKLGSFIKQNGFIHKIVPVDSKGRVEINTLEELVDENTLLVSIMAANNVIGTIQEIKKISNILENTEVLFHSDAAQSLSKMDIDVDKWRVDFLSLSAHKGYGPKGIGALYIRGGPNKQPIDAIMYGGGQENGVRPGTQNLPAIVGFAKACELASNKKGKEKKSLANLRDRIERMVLKSFPDAKVIGDINNRLPTVTNLHLPGVEADALISRLTDVQISAGSACESGAIEPSHVLQAVGLNRKEAGECIRLSIGRFSKTEDLVKATHLLINAIRVIKKIDKKIH